MPKPKAATTDPILNELIAIKRLMVFALLQSGATQAQVAAALGTGQSQVSRMFPNGLTHSARKTNQGK